MPSFSFILLMVSEKKIFEYFFEILPFMLPLQPIKLSDLDKIHKKCEGLLNKHFCKNKIQISPMTQQKLSISYFSYYKSMETISCHSNQSSYPTRIKKHNFLFPLPIDAMCVIWKESAFWFQRRCRLKMLTDDRRTPDACIYYKLTYEPSAHVS